MINNNHSKMKERAQMQPETTRTRYEPPELKVLGRLDQLTQQNFQNSEVDYNQNGLTLTGLS